MIKFYILLCFFFYSINSTSPQCELELLCINECLNLKIGSTSITLGTPTTYTDSEDNTLIYKNYIISTQCQIGDRITFTNQAIDKSTDPLEEHQYYGGFMGKLTITDDHSQTYEYNPSDSNSIFSCDICNSNPVEKSLVSSGVSSTHQIFEYSGISEMEITIEIPIEIASFTEQTFDNIITSSSSQTFKFIDYIIPKISGGDLSPLSIKITSMSNRNYFKFYKTADSTSTLNINSEIPVSEEITFERIDPDGFGLVELEYEVITKESLGKHKIKFNVCYKYCQTCNIYDSDNPSEKKCIDCQTDCYLIEGNNIERDRCFSKVDEIDIDYTNYFEDNDHIYKKCDESCKTCETNKFNCKECNKEQLYYFVEGLSDTNKQCYDLNYINGQGKYYLYPSDADTFNLCKDNCKSCRFNYGNCFSCENNKYFYSDEINKCQDKSDTSYYLFEDGQDKTKIKIDETCNTISNNKNKKKCDTCATDFFKYDTDTNGFCYREQEIYSIFGINNFKDTSVTNAIYKKCGTGCLLCDSNECFKCMDNYYFVEDYTGCKTIEEINNLPGHYYLPIESNTYYKCNQFCNCNFTNDYCLNCDTGYQFTEEENSCTTTPTTTKAGYYLVDNSEFKKCDKSCLECNGEGPDKCTKCAVPYYLIKLNDDIQRCITQIEKNENNIYDNYYLNTDTAINEFKKCDSSCATCDDGTTNNKCITCNNDYCFYEDGGQECISKNDNNYFYNTHQNYYYNTKLEEYRLCHSSCSSCKDGEVYNNCYQCSTNYAFIDDVSKGKCVLESLFTSTLTNYYKVEHVNTNLRNGEQIEVVVYKKCPENCAKCDTFEDSPLKCLVCDNDKGYYKQNDISIFDNTQQQECKANYIKEHRYFNGEGYSQSMSECLISTYETEQKKSCIECHNKYGYYSLEHAQETCQNIIPIDHYISSDNLIKKCPYECAACSEGPTSYSTNCDVCKEEFPPSISNPKNCIFQCEYYVYKYYDNKYCTGEKECPELAKFLYKENSTCVDKCEKVSYYGICLDECPPKTYKSGNECRDYSNTCTLSKFNEIIEHLVDLKNNNEPIIKKVKKYKEYFSYTAYHIDMYTHYLNEYIMLIYQKSDCINQLLPDLISVDFTTIFYPEREYIEVLFLVPRDNKYDKIYYQLYRTNLLNSPINLASYSNKIKVQIPAKQANFDYEKYQKLYNKGIYLDNYLENFFYDMCFQNYENGKDIIIKQRRREYYQDPCKICLDNCTFIKPPNNYQRANCQCQLKTNYLDELYQEYLDTNKYCVMSEDFYKTNIYIFEHFKCFKYNFEKGNIFENMGNYMMIVFIIIEIISVVIYLVYAIDSIKIYIIDFIKGNPPKKDKISRESEDELNNENDNNVEIKTISNSNNKYTSSNINEENSSKNKKYKKKNSKMSNNYIANNQKIKRWEEPELLIGRSNNLGNSEFKNKDVKIYERITKKETIIETNNNKNINNEIKEGNEIKNSSVLFKSTIKLKNPADIKNTNFKKHSHVFTDKELNSMELYDALIKDKRDFCYFYKLQMKEKQEFYRAFCINEHLYPNSIKIFVYIFNLSLNLNFNALLYTEKQIYEGVKSMGKNIGNIFLRAFYTFLIVKGIDYIIGLLIKNSNYLRSLVIRRKREKELRIEAYKSLKNIKSNFCFFIVFVFICDALLWFFIVSYCYCYNGEQLELFGAFLVTQFYMEIYCILFGLYLACFRFLGMKYKATTCYKMSQTFLDN